MKSILLYASLILGAMLLARAMSEAAPLVGSCDPTAVKYAASNSCRGLD